MIKDELQTSQANPPNITNCHRPPPLDHQTSPFPIPPYPNSSAFIQQPVLTRALRLTSKYARSGALSLSSFPSRERQQLYRPASLTAPRDELGMHIRNAGHLCGPCAAHVVDSWFCSL
ncbi:hypothetical protein BKA80DRAFT_283317 [Phyllosticta citrichinensis]